MTGNKNTVFFETFIGEQVEIITKMKTKMEAETQEGTVIQSDFLRMQGFLLDMDNEYYYIGDTGDSVAHAIKINEVSVISIAKSELDGILDVIETPDDPKGFN